MNTTLARAAQFCQRFGLQRPILLAPMAGASAPALSIAVMKAGGLGACGALLMSPTEISDWVAKVRAYGGNALNLNLWIPDPAPIRDAHHELCLREFLGRWGPSVAADAADRTPPDFATQCEALVAAKPAVASSVMGLFPADVITQLKQHGIAWVAHVTTVGEARAAEAAGADVIAAQGMEAGGHRGSFDASLAERQQVGLFALLPTIVDAVHVPVIAAGGIADGRGVAAALTLGASAVQIGTGFLRCPEARIPSAWAEALAHTAPENTMLTRAFSGRAGRSIATDYALAAAAGDAPLPASYPVQRGLTANMRAEASRHNDLRCMQAWAGQAASLAKAMPAGELLEHIWTQARTLLA